MSAPRPILIEVCVDSARSLEQAVAGGADRIELCSALALGGLTPSPGLVAQAAACPIPVRAMIRPRAGHFDFEASEVATMLRDIDAMREAGLAGVVIGATTCGPDGHGVILDRPVLERLVERAQGMAVTLHRAVDVLDDPADAVACAAALGIDTILTSGGAATAAEGVAMLARMVGLAAPCVTIMAGSGVDPDNAVALVAATGVGAVHGSFGAALAPVASRYRDSAPGFGEAPARGTAATVIRDLRARLGLG